MAHLKRATCDFYTEQADIGLAIALCGGTGSGNVLQNDRARNDTELADKLLYSWVPLDSVGLPKLQLLETKRFSV